MRKITIINLGIVFLSLGTAFYFYGVMPETVASHWNAQGQVDGYMSKFWGMFLMPLISLAMLFLLLIIPKIDPLKANIEKFKKYFDVLISAILIFLFYIYLLTIFWNLGYEFNMSRFMAPAMGMLFYACGFLIGKSKRNYFIGIRTPWTLYSDEVWDKTHKLGAKLFKLAGLLALFGAIFPKQAILFILVPVIAATIFLLAYSYFVYRHAQR